MTRDLFIKNLWLWKCNMPEIEEKPVLDDLAQTEWSPEFERLQRNRLIMGAFRYGRLSIPGKPVYDRIQAAMKRLEEYELTGNDELLVDVATFMLLEFVEGSHPFKHFSAVDDGPHVEVKQ